jgi:hypothetical protein
VPDVFIVVALKGDIAVLAPARDVVSGELVEIPTAELPGPTAPGSVYVGEILVEDGEYATDLGPAGVAIRTTLKATRDHWEGAKGRAVPYPPDLDHSARQRAQKAEFWLLPEGLASIPGRFTDLPGFLAKDKPAPGRDSAAWQRNRTQYNPDAFVNPYNFVPFASDAPPRARAAGHHRRDPGLNHGVLEAEFVAKSPLLVRDAGSGPDRTTVFARRGDQLVIPGSSAKGAVRSLFETITGSCLRVADQEYRPAYRDVLRPTNRAGWTLIEVTEVDRQHRPTTVRRASEGPMWIAFDVLERALGRHGVRTGARVHLTGSPKKVGKPPTARLEVRDPDAVAPSGPGKELVLLVTDVRARPKDKGVCFAAAPVGRPEPAHVDPDAWRRFEAALDGVDDLKRGESGKRGDRDGLIRVDIDKKVRGTAYRQLQGVETAGLRVAGLREGHVLWARFDNAGSIVDLAFAQTWRHGSTGPALGERIPAGFEPCTGQDVALCPACRVFGSADTRGGSGDGGAYRGQVRVGDWRVEGASHRVDLAPLGAPRPGSGQMYLTHADGTLPEKARGGQVPLREWGSELDPQGRARPLRGRKYYWRTGEVAGRPPRHTYHGSHSKEDNAGRMRQSAEVVGAEAEVTGTLVFENLTDGELGALVASLNPGVLSQFQHEARKGAPGDFCLPVGGGKPLGLGSLQCTRLRLRLEADRYGSEADGDSDVTPFVEALASSTGEAVRRTWPDLLELLRLNAVDPAMVSYPRTKSWPKERAADAADLYEAGFDWWSRSAGMADDSMGSSDPERLAEYTYLPLPHPTAQRVTLPVDPRRREKR